MQSSAAIEITLRFKAAVECVNEKEGWGTVARFCKRHEINVNQFRYTLKHPELRALQPHWIAALCSDYKLSAEWIVTGRGIMAKRHK